MDPKRRLSQTTPSSANKLRFDSLNKILKIGSNKSKKHKRATISKQVSRVALAELLKNTPTQHKQDLPDFKSFLANQVNVHLFREFLKTQYCQENIDFYLACERFRQLNPDKGGQVLIKFMATQIYNDYLAENAEQPVNIDHNCLQNITRHMRDPKPNLFCDAQAEIFDLMRNDCYPRFCKTWLLDRKTARKILVERPMAMSTPQSKIANSIITSCTTSNPDVTISSQRTTCSALSQQKGQKRKSISQSNKGCPPKCPYFCTGLPCQQHNIDEQDNQVEQTGSSDLIDKIDLRRIHHVPNICKRRTPPPPPLPPKPDKTELELSPVINKRFRPYVGKVFDV